VKVSRELEKGNEALQRENDRLRVRYEALQSAVRTTLTMSWPNAAEALRARLVKALSDDEAHGNR
jgi:hypothetical protein